MPDPTANDLMPLVHPYSARPFFQTSVQDLGPGSLGIRMSNGQTPGYLFDVVIRHRTRATAKAFLAWYETQRGQRGEWTWHCPFYDDDFTCRFLTDEPNYKWVDANEYIGEFKFVGVKQ